MSGRAGALGGAAALVTWLASNCARHALLVTALAVGLAGAATWYVTSHFAIDTDTSGLISTDLPWRQRDAAFAKAFPQHDDLIAIVIDGDGRIRHAEYVADQMAEPDYDAAIAAARAAAK